MCERELYHPARGKMASEAGTASGSGSFSDFWQRTGKKFKFVPSNRKGSGGEGEQGGNGNQFLYFWKLVLVVGI